ncbi:LytR/AlgR family response regulator transcription factor [Ferruginibacter sp. SUN002]|uniref:LytR/AlgR family response regulator transcription factor n=1 Tax=Ferruginibacter sp. SUN002 TaxID=2937789 RepID=UPI003D36AA8D
MTFTILVIEDDPIDLISIKAKLRELGYDEPVVADQKADINSIMQATTPQLVISDIYYDHKPLGLALIDICKTYNTPLILITADTRFDTYNLASQHDKVTYLVKPFHHFTLKTCIDMLLTQVSTQASADDKFYFVKDYTNHKVKLNYKDIMFLESDGNACHIHCMKDKYLMRMSLAKLGAELDDRFVQVHKSYIVNRDNVSKISAAHLQVATHEIPIGRKYKGEIVKLYPGVVHHGTS